MGGWLLGLSDLSTALEAVTRGGVGLWPNSWVAASSALVAVLFGGWYFTARSPRASLPFDAGDGRRILALVVITVAVVALGIASMQLRGSCISFEARHQQYGGFLALPLLASSLAGHFRRQGGPARLWAAALGLAVIATPVVYGVGALAHNVLVHLPQGPGTTGGDGLARQWIEPGANAVGIDAEITRLAPAPAVLATTSPVVALAYPERRLLVAWGPGIPATVAAGGLAVLLPRWTPQSDAEARARFPGVRAWTAHNVGGGARLLVAAGAP